MAGLRFNVNSNEVALVAATAKSVLQIKAPANQRVFVRKLRLFGKQPAGGTDTPVKVRMTKTASGGAFGTFTAITMTNLKVDSNAGESIQSTAGSNATVEPTTSTTDSGLWWEFSPQSGLVEFLPENAPIVIKGGEAINFECTSPGTPTVMIQAECEE